MRIFGWPADFAGCAWYRIHEPLNELSRRGHEVTATRVALGTADDAMYAADVVVGQRVCTPGPSARWAAFRLYQEPRYREWLRASWRSNRDLVQVVQKLDARPGGRPKLVFEIDDDLWQVDRSSPRAFEWFAQPEIRRRLAVNARLADVVTVSTPALGEVLSRFNQNVHVIPNAIPAALLEHEPPRRTDGVITVGWAGSYTHAMDWAMVDDELVRYLKKTRRAELHVMGGMDPLWSRVPQHRMRVTGWTDSVDDYRRKLDFHIGVIPLKQHPFNESKCLDIETRLTTKRGVLRIGDVQAGDDVWHAEGWRRVHAADIELPRPGIEITTAEGYQLRLTPEHRMLVNGEWVTADKIRVGDTMAAEPEAVGPTASVRVPWPADSRMSRNGFDPKAFLSAPDGPRLDITARWGRFLGAFVGDGSAGQSTVIQISCDGQDQDWIDLLMEDLRAFGLNPTTEAITTYNGQVLRRRGIKVASAHLLRVMASLGLTRPRPSGAPIRVPCVPEVIWQSPREVIAEFLAGYFEADGHCTSSGVSATSKDEQLIRDVQRLLLLFGIESKVRTRQYKAQNGFTGMYWNVNLGRAAADVFAKEIGFRSARKRTRLAEITGRPHSNAYRPMSWQWKVTELKPVMVTPVDIQVDGEIFAAAGFVSHNSFIKALEFGACGIPVVASDVGPYRDFVRHGETGWLVRKPGEFLRYLLDLTHDEAMREEMGRNARKQAAEHTVEASAHLWEEALQP